MKRQLIYLLILFSFFSKNIFHGEPSPTPVSPDKTSPTEEPSNSSGPTEKTDSSATTSPDKAPTKEMPAIEEAGPETADFAEDEIGIQGNWVKKKEWLKQAQEKNDSIQDVLVDVKKNNQKFYDNFKLVDFDLDIFYKQVGFSRGKLNEQFEEIQNDLTKTLSETKQFFKQAFHLIVDEEDLQRASEIKDKYADLSEIDDVFKSNYSKLNQLKSEIEWITKLDDSLKERLKKFDEHLNQIESKANNAKNLSDKIWQVIDHEKAKKIYYDISAINEKVKSIQQFFDVDFSKDFENVISLIREQIAKANTSVQSLEKNGIIIINRTERIEEARKKEDERVKQKIKREQERPKPKKSPKPQPGFLESTWNQIKLIFTSIYQSIIKSE